MKMLTPDKFQVVYLPGNHPAASFRDIYERTYSTWMNVWRDYFRTLPTPMELWSDPFTRQDEVVSLLYEGECIAVNFFRWVDFNLIDQTRDSYFKLWKPEDFALLLEKGRKVMVPSFLTVHEDCRRGRCDVDIPRLLIGLSIKRFLLSNADAMPVITRNAKGVNDMFYSHGAVPLRRDVVNFHEADKVDFVGIFRETCRIPDEEPLRGLVESVWSDRMVAETDLSLKTGVISFPRVEVASESRRKAA